MPSYHTRFLIALMALVMLGALASCAGITSAPAPPNPPLPALALVPTTIPLSVRNPERDDEIVAEVYFQTWISAVTTGNAETARIVYHVNERDPSVAIEREFKALQTFITYAEQSEMAFGTYQGFHHTVGTYAERDYNHRTGIALMLFEHRVICFSAKLHYIEASNIWSVEAWHPIIWDLCESKMERMSQPVKDAWGF